MGSVSMAPDVWAVLIKRAEAEGSTPAGLANALLRQALGVGRSLEPATSTAPRRRRMVGGVRTPGTCSHPMAQRVGGRCTACGAMVGGPTL